MAISSSEKAKPVILVVASMDAASFFRDKSIGADSPISVSYFFSVVICITVVMDFLIMLQFACTLKARFFCTSYFLLNTMDYVYKLLSRG